MGRPTSEFPGPLGRVAGWFGRGRAVGRVGTSDADDVISDSAVTWMVVGLGNPGPQYAGNRHNVGFHVLDELAGRRDAAYRSHKGRADVATVRLVDSRALLVKPRSYMNTSGPAVAAVRAFYQVPVERIVVVHDELDLPFGGLRVKRGGGDNGHNGLRSITQAVGSPDYCRVRFGIGRPPGRMDPAAFVLRDFTAAERAELPTLIDRAADAAEMLAVSGLAPTQNQFNG